MVKITKGEIRQVIADASCGLISNSINAALFILYSIPALAGTYNQSQFSRAFQGALDEIEDLGINKESIKKALYKLSQQDLARRPTRDKLFWQITSEGKRRMRSLIPTYQEKRSWDGKLYLITYDIPEKQKRNRESLRKHLKIIGCGELQKSVWLTPYNPAGVLQKFIKEKNLKGMVIISTVGKDGNIGEDELGDLINNIYHLDELNEDYRHFIYRYRHNQMSKTKSAFEFLSILSKDPQLPFKLLPYDWQGKIAYEIYRNIFLI